MKRLLVAIQFLVLQSIAIVRHVIVSSMDLCLIMVSMGATLLLPRTLPTRVHARYFAKTTQIAVSSSIHELPQIVGPSAQWDMVTTMDVRVQPMDELLRGPSQMATSLARNGVRKIGVKLTMERLLAEPSVVDRVAL